MTEPKPAGRPSGPCRLVLAWIIAVVVIWSVAAIYGQVGKPDQNVELPQSYVDVLRAGTDRIIDVSPSTVNPTEETERRRFYYFPLFPAISYLLGGSNQAALAGILLKPFLASVCIDVECAALVRDNFL